MIKGRGVDPIQIGDRARDSVNRYMLMYVGIELWFLGRGGYNCILQPNPSPAKKSGQIVLEDVKIVYIWETKRWGILYCFRHHLTTFQVMMFPIA